MGVESLLWVILAPLVAVVDSHPVVALGEARRTAMRTTMTTTADGAGSMSDGIAGLPLGGLLGEWARRRWPYRHFIIRVHTSVLS